jgi:hypothetical protein
MEKNSRISFCKRDVKGLLVALSLLLERQQYRLNDEKQCQEDIGDWLKENNIYYEAEFKLSAGGSGIVDFYLPNSRLAIEVKAAKRWSKLAVLRQCERYCLDDNVDGLLLATAKFQGLPAELCGKPSIVLLLSRASL